jgi:hypothetical protein
MKTLVPTDYQLPMDIHCLVIKQIMDVPYLSGECA